jgi:2,5-diamino-6-(ribosylamino)-4(3H)-pyrimidinone 5'-phosphate reductase
MTHFLRSRCEAVLVGAGTAVADDPGLNCRLRPAPGERRRRQPTGVVVDPSGRWNFGPDSKMVRLAREEAARRREDGGDDGPMERRPTMILVVDALDRIPTAKHALLAEVGGAVLVVPRAGPDPGARVPWADVLRALKRQGVRSVMVEGGADVARSLLARADRALVHGVVVAVAPVWLGERGVQVAAPGGGAAGDAVRLADVKWLTLGEDAVVCGFPAA